MCKVSIIIPLYNGEDTIQRCLDSLIEQSLHDLEIIVIDDGSKDKGSDKVREYIKKDTRIRLIEQKNAGPGAARNRGVKEAKGKYLGFIDCDDYVDRDMFRVMTDGMEKNRVSVAVCQEKSVYCEEGKEILLEETKYPCRRNTVYSSDHILKWQLNYEYMSLNSMCYKVIERSLFIEKKVWAPENFRCVEDLVTSVGIFSNVDKVLVVPKSFYYYVHRKNSRSNTYSIKQAQDIYLDWKDCMSYLRRMNYSGVKSNFSLGMYFASMKNLYLMDQSTNKDAVLKIKNDWEAARKRGNWKPDFTDMRVPFLHRVKVYVMYLKIYPVVFMIVKKLQWIPFIKYML